VRRARNILSLILAVGLLGLAGASSASATSCPNTDAQVSGLSQDQMESSIGCLINEERASFGLQPVQSNAKLRQAALSHSREMISEGYFEHTSPAGLSFVDRIEQYGYMKGVRSWDVGENLVWGSEQLSTPGALVTAWMNSPPHRENLLRGRYTEIGIAAVVGTPEDANDATGVTVSSEYGYRTPSRKGHVSRAKARKSKSRKHHRH
jgi:uncharacterized protein YkwD